MAVVLIKAKLMVPLSSERRAGRGSHSRAPEATEAPRPHADDAGRAASYSHMGFSCPMSSSFVHLAHSFLSVLMEQRMGPQGLPQSSMAGTLR